MTNVNLLSPSWFKTLGTRLLAGRDFTEQDVDCVIAPVAIVNEAFARKFFDGSNPLGRQRRHSAPFAKNPAVDA